MRRIYRFNGKSGIETLERIIGYVSGNKLTGEMEFEVRKMSESVKESLKLQPDLRRVNVEVTDDNYDILMCLMRNARDVINVSYKEDAAALKAVNKIADFCRLQRMER